MLALGWTDWLTMLGHFATVSLLAVGGGIAVLPDVHRVMVSQHAWLNEAQFTSAVALSQAAPGPNVLFVLLLGWQVGLNAGGGALPFLGATLCLLAMVLPSSVLTLLATRWAHRRHRSAGVQAFRKGMAPVVVALMASTAWLLGPAARAQTLVDPLAWALTLGALLLVWRTRIHLLWLLGIGALAGALGWI